MYIYINILFDKFSSDQIIYDTLDWKEHIKKGGTIKSIKRGKG